MIAISASGNRIDSGCSLRFASFDMAGLRSASYWRSAFCNTHPRRMGTRQPEIVHDMFRAMTGSKTSDAGNLFLAIIPDADVAARIYESAEIIRRARGFRAPVIARDRLHVTLLSLNRFTDSEVSATCQAIGEMRSAPFEVSFDRTMSFRGKPGILPFVLAGDDGLKTLRSFRRSLTVELTRKGLGDRGRREFTPHVTLFFGNRAVEEHPFWPIRMDCPRHCTHPQHERSPASCAMAVACMMEAHAIESAA